MLLTLTVIVAVLAGIVFLLWAIKKRRENLLSTNTPSKDKTVDAPKISKEEKEKREANRKEIYDFLIPFFFFLGTLWFTFPEILEMFLEQKIEFQVFIVIGILFLIFNPKKWIEAILWLGIVGLVALAVYNHYFDEDEIAPFAEMPMVYQESKPQAQTVSPGVVKTTKGNTNTYTLTIGAEETKKVVVPEGDEVAINNCPQGVTIKIVLTESGKKAENFIVDCSQPGIVIPGYGKREFSFYSTAQTTVVLKHWPKDQNKE